MRPQHVHQSTKNLDYNAPGFRFESASIVIPVTNEVMALREIVDTVLEAIRNDMQEIIIVVCDRTTSESLSACELLKAKYPGSIKIIKQTMPFLGGALRDGILAAEGSHVVVLYGDGESDPCSVKNLIEESKKRPGAIISASRWMKGSSFEGYPAVKTFFNYLFQKLFSIIYWKNITDFTFGYRIYPRSLMCSIEWTELKHPFVFESILKPLLLDIEIKEIPTSWKRRWEGKSQLNSIVYLRYLWIGLTLRLTRLQCHLKKL